MVDTRKMVKADGYCRDPAQRVQSIKPSPHIGYINIETERVLIPMRDDELTNRPGRGWTPRTSGAPHGRIVDVW